MTRPQFSRLFTLTLLVLTLFSVFADPAMAAKRRRRAKHYGPPPTHPVVLWARTLSESTDREQRKIAAFKLSQYSLQIFQDEAIRTLGKCSKDPDTEIRVLCVKAMGKAGTSSQADSIRQALLENYKADPSLRNTIVRAFIVREDGSPQVHDTFLEAVKTTTDVEERLVLLKYFDNFGSGSDKFVDTMVDVFKKSDNAKIRNEVVTALSARGKGQDGVIALLTQCTESHDTPLVLNCLSGLQQQGKKDPRTWTAIEKSILSDDPDVLMATLDVINSMPEAQNVKVANRLVELVDKVEDEDLQEKIVLGLGVCGDRGQPTVTILQRLLQDKTVDDGVRTAAALTLGKQSDQFPGKPQEVLATCSTTEKSQALRTACQLGAKEIKARQTLNAANAPATTPASATTAPPPASDRKPAETAKSDSDNE
jgi:HEAT repeat protein